MYLYMHVRMNIVELVRIYAFKLKTYNIFQGGIKAVVWTDVFQTIVIFGALITVIIKGAIDVGGLPEVWIKAKESQRTEIIK